MSTITPTVGRVVWYYPGQSDAEAEVQGNLPMAAVITFVHPGREQTINLVVFDHDGNPRPRQHVPLWDGTGDRPLVEETFAEWMPYQLGQAAKTESLTGLKIHDTDLALADLSNPAGPLHFPDDSRLDFGDALKLLKKGEAITRMGWNGKGLWLELSGPGVNPDITVPFVVLCYPDGVDGHSACVPWAPSQTDMLADDWVVVQ